MNYTPLDEAYKTHHVSSNTYGGIIQYSQSCIYCSYPSSKSLLGSRDGGAFRQCDRCRKNFRATIINDAVKNYSYSTGHLKGTN